MPGVQTQPVNRLWSIAAILSAAVLGLAAIYAAGIDYIDPKLQRGGSLALALIVGIAASRSESTGRDGDTPAVHGFTRNIVDLALLLGGFWSLWQFYVVQGKLASGLYLVNGFDAIPAIIGLVVLLELCRRLWGYGLFAVGALALIYLAYGQGMPSIFQHSPFSYADIADSLWYNTNKGVLGSITNIVLNTVLIFIIFGALLEGTGAGNTLLKFAFVATRRSRGGPAHAAILSSSLFGSMSGSTVANIVGTGTFTIPMMKRRGFAPAFAGAVEATASSGGQIMPPIMGAAALVMADITGTNYLLIIVAAIVPALLYYASLFASVTVEARRLDIKVKPLAVDDRLTRVDLINSVMFILPIMIVIWTLVQGFSAARAGFYATAALVLLSIINPEVRRDPMRLVRSFLSGSKSGGSLLIAVASISIIVGTLDSTGLGLKLANVIADLRGEGLLQALLVAMCGALVLGMGMPTLPAYLIIVLVMGPALQQLGVSTLTAHMFVFYFGVASSLTPPVAIAAYAAAPIAGANPLSTSITAFRLGLVKFLVPFMFVYYPSLLIVESFDWGEFIWALVRCSLAIWLAATALGRFDRTRLTPTEIVLRLIAAALVLVTWPSVQFAAIAMGILLITWDLLRARRSQTATNGA